VADAKADCYPICSLQVVIAGTFADQSKNSFIFGARTSGAAL
jgi:hypothetical protein